MGTRFTRVTVVGDGRQLDISLPADLPLAAQVPTVLRLLSVPVGAVPVRWRLAAPEFGALDPAGSLDQAGVLDGALLHLTEAAADPLPPFVDDVESAVAELVAQQAPAWSGPARPDVVGALASLLLLVALVVAVYAPVPVRPALLLITAAALALGRLVSGRGGWAAALVAVPAAGALALATLAAWPDLLGAARAAPATGPSVGPDFAAVILPADLGAALEHPGVPLAVLAVAALALAAAGAARRASGVVVGAMLLALVTAAAVLCRRLGLPADRTAALALLVAVVLAGLAGQLALGGAGLVDLMVADERGEPVPRQRVVSAVLRGLGLATGVVWTAVAVAAAACWLLVTGIPPGAAPGWEAPAFGVLGGLVFGLRSRMFSRTHQVGAMLVVVVATAAATAVAAPRWLTLHSATGSWVTLAALATTTAIVLGTGMRSLREVAGARVQRALERLELLAVLALIPGLVLLFQVIPTVRHWWA